MPSATPLRVFGSISRFLRMMLGSGISHTELLAVQDDLEWRIVTDAAARNACLMGAVDARRLAAARNVMRQAQLLDSLSAVRVDALVKYMTGDH
jgi:hypothetical protein